MWAQTRPRARRGAIGVATRRAGTRRAHRARRRSCARRSPAASQRYTQHIRHDRKRAIGGGANPAPYSAMTPRWWPRVRSWRGKGRYRRLARHDGAGARSWRGERRYPHSPRHDAARWMASRVGGLSGGRLEQHQ
ncbi:MAG: hypothetical protein AVDCRST_MAG67-966 [uncultured Solirubrobacteraceae bacterium]|uniref:Uncharacterized protein n=1 Tax=uncultured Solirubrobacteraceae bacterium TaxID=1162706 RepID=A0A6J4RUN1_9ACTN|nr:MAG: hypothetical protein AVDCRST_MAG67-966 [uncultured Solirubrobacteraceae bacterium]